MHFVFRMTSAPTKGKIDFGCNDFGRTLQYYGSTETRKIHNDKATHTAKI